MKKKFLYKSKQLGQGFILALMTITLAATSVALYGLNHSQNAYRSAVEFKHANDIMNVFNGMAKWLEFLYHYEANCDPYVFNNLINHYAYRQIQSPFNEQSLNNAPVRPFMITVGEISPLPIAVHNINVPLGSGAGSPYSPYYQLGAGAYGPQDISVTFWATPYLGLDSVALTSGSTTRYEQTITLINTCTFVDRTTWCGGGAPDPACAAGPQFGQIQPAPYAAAVAAEEANLTAALAATRGDANGDGLVNVTDRMIFQSFLKTGDITTMDAANFRTNMDMNNDGLLNETDLNILDKSLKGHLHFTAPSFF